MTNPLLLFLLVFIWGNDCECDQELVENKITQMEFKTVVKTDPRLVADGNFRKLNEKENQTLWYEEIQFPKKTIYTSLWDDYSSSSYHASHQDFIDYFKDKSDIELAFQFGPNSDLWAYHVFTIKKVDCCYIATRSYFRHARFTYKAYSILTPETLDKLYQELQKLPQKVHTKITETYAYQGYFRDNRNNKTYIVDFENETELIPHDTTITKYPDFIDTNIIYNIEPKSEITSFFDFIDKQIKWTTSYEI